MASGDCLHTRFGKSSPVKPDGSGFPWPAESHPQTENIALAREKGAYDPVEGAGPPVCLNRHSFNDLARYNAKGQSNVPFGKDNAPCFPLAGMRDFFQKTREADTRLACCDFRKVFASLKKWRCCPLRSSLCSFFRNFRLYNLCRKRIQHIRPARSRRAFASGAYTGHTRSPRQSRHGHHTFALC